MIRRALSVFFPLAVAAVAGKVVRGVVDGVALAQLPQMLHQKLRIQRIGMVVVQLAPFLKRQVVVRLVVKVVRKYHGVFAE